MYHTKTLTIISVFVFCMYLSCTPSNKGDTQTVSLDDTTFEIDPKAYELTKEEKIALATQLLNDYKEEQLQLCIDEVIPIILTSVADRFAIDYERILTEYNGTGGFKIYDNYDDFYKAWYNNFFWDIYRNIVNKQVEAYVQANEEYYKDLCNQLGINNYVNLTFSPSCFNHFNIPQKDIEQFVDEEQDKTLVTIGDIAIDGVLLIVEGCTAGAATPIVVGIKVAQGAKTTYDIVSTADELFFDETIENNEKLMITITESILLQLGTYLEKEFKNYFERQNRTIITQLENEII